MMNFTFTPDFDWLEDDDEIYFFDLDPSSLPSGNNQYYFNVLVKCIALRPGDMELPLIAGIVDLWYIEHITDPRPWVAHFYIDEENAKDKVEEYPHCVVEVCENGELAWYPMIAWDTIDRWDFEKDWSKFEEDYEDEEDDDE